MRIRVLGGGFYGCHMALELLKDGHEVELHEIADRLFSGASGNIPARLHTGAHYPRSQLTRRACQGHFSEFMDHYGDFTRNVPVNIYAIAEYDSLLDFGTYKKILKDEVPFLNVRQTQEYGLRNVEGALIIDERHIIVDDLRDYFEGELKNYVKFESEVGFSDSDLTIDATFCANDGIRIDRYEVCLTVLLEGSSYRAVTIMDGPFPSLYPWDEKRNICSLTSAKITPMYRCNTWSEAKHLIDIMPVDLVENEARTMIDQMAWFYPNVREFKKIEYRLAIRALPHSAADARLVDIISIDENTLRIRAGKMDAIFEAKRVIQKLIDKRTVELAA